MKVKGPKGIQGTPEWLEFRKSCITATDISSILGLNPWESKRQCWRRKMDLDPPKPDNEHMKRGRELEEEARQLFCKITCSCLEPEVHQHPDYPWAMASLDGINLDGDEILEVKCPSRAPPEEVPPMYYAQCQWQLFCSDAKLNNYTPYFEGDIRTWKLPRDEAFIQKALEAAIEFRDSMLNYIEPEDDKPLLAEITCPESLYRLDRYNELCEKIEELEKERSALREHIIADAKGQACRGGGFRVFPVERLGNVDYSQIPELKSVKLDNYRKPKTFFWTIKKES